MLHNVEIALQLFHGPRDVNARPMTIADNGVTANLAGRQPLRHPTGGHTCPRRELCLSDHVVRQ
jgi:hypothetical protein